MANRFQTSKVTLISLAHFSHDVYTSILAPLLPLLVTKLGLSLSMVGVLDVVRKIPSLFNPLIGIMADKICIKYLIILAPALSTIFMSLLGLAPSYLVLLILLFFTGISSAMFHVPSPVAIKNFSGDKAGLGMSFYMVGGELARSVGPLLITAAVSWWGLEGSYKIMPLGIIASFLLFLKLRNVKNIVRLKTSNKKTTKAISVKTLIPLFTFIGSFILFRAAMKSALTLYLPLYLTQQGESIWWAGISLSVFQFAGAMGTLGAGFISDKIGRKNTLLISALLSPLLMWAFIHANAFWLWPILIVTGLLLFAQGPVLLALFQETNTDRPAFVNGIYMSINFVINSLMILLVGVSGDYLGLDLTYQISALLAILSIPFVYFLPNLEKETNR